MSNNLSVTVDGVHEVGKKAYLTVDGMHRKVKKMYLTTDGVHRLCYHSDINFNLWVSQGDTVCVADDGMTWAEWVASDYNTLSIIVADGYVYQRVAQQGYLILDYDNNHAEVLSTDVIRSGGSYGLM